MKSQGSLKGGAMEEWKSLHKGYLEFMGIAIEKLEPEEVVASQEIDHRHLQPFGILHGGVSIALAETVASIGAWRNVEEGEMAVGLEISANHLRPGREGILRARALPLHRGRTTQVWDVTVTNGEESKIVSLVRCTLAVVPRR